DVARRRPLQDAATVRRGRRKGEAVAELRDETRRRLEWLGRERALIYKTLVLTGLRKGELASITVAQLDLNSDPAFLTLNAADEKNREGNSIAIRSDLAAELRDGLTDKAAAMQAAASEAQTIKFDPLNKTEGITVILSEQFARPVLPVINRGYVVENGMLTLTGTGKELMNNPEIKAAYFGV
ncbi:MAG: hypothetical protein R6V76_04420, partial [Desulfobacterales bacterium]